MENLKYNSIQSPVEAIWKVSGSSHHAFVFPVKSEEEIGQKIKILWQRYPDATHICYAWRLGADNNLFRTNDDGEPSGTAGKPILGQLLSFELSDVLVCVVRYFGGTKLGTGGLIDAYKTAARLALDNAVIVEHLVCNDWVVEFSYDLQGKIMHWMKFHQLEKLEFVQGELCRLKLKIPRLNEVIILRDLEPYYTVKVRRDGQ